MSKPKGWKNDRYEHSLASKGVKSKLKGECKLPNPMNTRKDKQLLLGHSITHTKNYQRSVGVEKARCEHDRLVKIMLKRGMQHHTPFKSKVKSKKR